MAVEFILGRSGSGKTARCISSIVDELTDSSSSVPLVLLVPEQATYQAERAILTSSGVCGFSRLRVLSFNRLEFLLSDSGSAGRDISLLGREMAVQKILRENRDQLQIFKNSALLPGLAQELTATIIELHECDKGCDDVAGFIEELNRKKANPLLAMKMADISLVLEKYLEFLDGGFVNPDIGLSEAVGKVGDADFLRGAHVWVDGFASFTIQQQVLLAEMMRVAGKSHVALCLDASQIDIKNPQAESLDPVSMFNQTERTYTQLVEIIKKCKLDLSVPVVLDEIHRFKESGALGHLERNLFGDDAEAACDAGDSISISYASNRRGEVQFVARKIVSLVRDKGLRFRDIAVIASDISAYQHYIEATFSDLGIEYFIDTPKAMQQHPVVELISSAMSAVTGGFSSSDIFAYLKTSLSQLSSFEVDVLENYCLAFGVEGFAWRSQRKWDFAGKGSSRFDEQSINELRVRAMGPLLKLLKDLPADKPATAGEFTRAIFGLLDELKVREKVAGWIEGGGDEDKGIHQQFFVRLVEIFDELVDVFGDEEMDVDELVSILQNAFSRLTLKLIPQKLDQVLVGSIDRSRHPELKAVFLIGTTQKQFPSVVSVDSILNEEDREAAWDNGFMLSERVCDQLGARQYLAYIAFTRPSEYLFISCPLADDDGKKIIPSPFVSNLSVLFCDLKPVYALAGDVGVEGITSENELADHLCESLGADSLDRSDELMGLAKAMCGDERFCGVGELVKKSLEYENAAAVDNAKWGGLPDVLRCSTSRLRSFAACPYQHFAKYILKLKERKIMGFEPMDLGSFYHKVLENVSMELKARCKDFATGSDDEIKNICLEQIQKVMEEDSAISNFVKGGMHNKFLIESAAEILVDCVCDYGEISRAGAFRQKDSEVCFGFDEKQSGRLKIDLAGGKAIVLNGVIDRVDIAEIDGERVALIFDYKRKETSVSWDKLCHGLELQLGVYMLAVGQIEIDGESVDRVVGAFYLPVEGKYVAKASGEIAAEDMKFARKAKGIFDGDHYTSLDGGASSGWNGYYNFYVSKDGPYGNYANSAALRPDEFDSVLGFVREKIAAGAEGIFSGDIGIFPYRLGNEIPCDYCDYKKVCRFDVHLNDFNDLAAVKKDEVVSRAGGRDE